MNITSISKTEEGKNCLAIMVRWLNRFNIYRRLTFIQMLNIITCSILPEEPSV